MSQDGFLFGELSEFKQDLMRSIKNDFPKETENFIKNEASKCLQVAKKVAKKEVGTSKGKKKNWIESKSYHKGFKVGKPYKYSNDLCCRAYNKSPHAHLIENGHVNVPRSSKRATTRAGRAEQAKQQRGTGFTMGKFVFKLAELEFVNQYLTDAEMFMFQFFDNTVNLKGKKGVKFTGELVAGGGFD